MKRLGLLIVLILLYIYHPWGFVNKTLSGGDWPYLFLENIKEFSFLPNGGVLWLVPYYQITAKIFVEYFGLSWNFAEKILWFWPFLAFSVISSFYLTKSWIGVLIYTTSTYSLMLVGGGQMGVAIAYSMAPLVLGMFIKNIDNFVLLPQNIKYQIFTGIILGIQMMFDPRITYITFIAIFLYFLLTFISSSNKKNFLVSSLNLIIPVFISLVLNSFWIVSLLKYGLLPQDIVKTSPAGFKFLSFADFSHTLSLLHPNWSENIFGKTYFMKAEFIALPILAYSSLFFISSKFPEKRDLALRDKTQNNHLISQYPNFLISFFALLGLVGAFLAKGANPSFGQVNEFLFEQIPGMNMFRDPTKFYLLTVLSYSVLIPFSLNKISKKVSSIKYQVLGIRLNIHNTYYIILTTFLVFWSFTIRPAVFGQLGGTFKPHEVPYEYVQLKDFLNSEPSSFKTLWVPERQRFGFSSLIHPSVNASEFYNNSSISGIIRELEKENVQNMMKKHNVKYLIVPYDSQKEIFLKDRKYDEKKHFLIIQKLQGLTWLKAIPSFKDIAVFEAL